MSEQNVLLPRVIRGAQWLFLGRVVARMLQLLRTFTLAVLLTPGDFDLIAVAFIIMNLLETISVTGFDVALIRMKGTVEQYLDTAWTVLLGRGLLLAGLLVIAASPVAALFEREFVESLLYVFAIAFVFRGMTNIGVVFFDREMTFHKRFIYLAGGAVADVAVSIAAAVIMRNAWALVFGVLARDVVQCVLSYILHPYRPRFRCDWSHARELFAFGKWILIENIVCYLLLNVDQILVGKALPHPSLGLYMMAYYLASGLIAEISGICSEVLFPAYAKLQDDAARLRNAYLEVVVIIVCIIAPMAAGICVIAPEFVPLVMGDEWTVMIPAVMILTAWGLERGIVSTMTPILRAVNRPEIGPLMNLIRFVGMAAAVYPLTVVAGWGITGTATAVVIGAAIAAPFSYASLLGVVRIRVGEFFGEIFPSLLAAGVMAALLLVTKHYFPMGGHAALLVLLILEGAVIYLATLLWLDHGRKGRVRSLAAKVFANLTSGRRNSESA